jgi:hypothetical protein
LVPEPLSAAAVTMLKQTIAAGIVRFIGLLKGRNRDRFGILSELA